MKKKPNGIGLVGVEERWGKTKVKRMVWVSVLDTGGKGCCKAGASVRAAIKARAGEYCSKIRS